MRSAVRRLAKVLPSVVLGAALALTAVVPAAKAAPVDGGPSWPVEQKTTVVDPSTITTWEGVAKDDTANIGRIWTDKTVSKTDVELPSGNEPAVKIGNSDFLVGLSALSSTSNTTTTSSRPLDIVLVLDVSGSMDDGLGGGFVYSPTYAVSESLFAPTYYAKTEDGKYQKIDRVGDSFTGLFFDHWELNGKEVLPKRSEGDTADGRIQFYERVYDSVSKIDGLKGAANQFITATAEKNGEITDKARQHRISIVKFAGEMRNTIGNNISRGRNYTQVVSDLKAYTPSTVSEATDTIDSLRTGGATSADYGLLQAQDVLNGRKAGNRVDELVGAREGAQKVVIFFTDGQPTYNNGFQDTVANNAIKTAQAMKAGGARVYSVGVFADANPGDTRGAFNAYMHGVSSNYPNAEAYSDLGSRAENSNYYKAATDADELNGIFQEISDEINKGTGLPTHTTEGMANKSGYITFTDELGAYMRVDGFRSLIFADKVFDPQSKTSNGLIDTYTYEGTGGNALYPNGNVKDIVVQVQRSEELAKGDIVTVKIPASLIPLRNFKVTTTEAGSTMEIGEAYPLRIFYGVSIKPEVHAAVMSGAADQALRDYIAGNTADGKTNFYSNFYDGRVIVEDGKRLGNTTASFEPSDANSFYYFTEDTPLYTDRECKIPLTKEPTAGQAYYYKRSYYKKGSAGQAEKAESIIKFRGVNFNRPEPYWSQAADGSYFIKKGAPRLTRVDSLTLTKESNVTGTATEVINPRWDNVDNPHMVNVSLGNNGKLSVDMPGSLAINKDARIAPNKNIDPKVLDGKSFEFEITIPSAADKTLTTEVRNAQNERVGEPFDMEFDASGKRRQSLKDEETLYIHGLDAGADYTVTEVKDKMPAGFKQTSAEGDTGKIAAGKTQAAKFVNTYDVEPVAMEGKDLAGYKKIFDRWDLAGSFDIELRAVQAGNPMPEGSTPGTDGRGGKVVQATEAKPAGDFGSISFDKPGVFEYTVREVAPSAEGVIPGMTYSNASYTIRVDVVDDGKGGLAATSSMTRTNNDAGVDVSEPVEGKNAVFTNSFNARETSVGPEAVKVYTNNGGPETAMKDGKFTFKVKPLTDGAPIPDGVQVQPDGYIHVKNSGSSVVFGQAVYGEDHVGHTYEYEISELIPAEADAGNGYTLNGMTYDPSVYIAAFTVSVDESATVKVSVSYYKMVDDAPEQLPEGQVPEFANVYDPEDVTLPGDTASPLKARKTLRGRDAVDGETFEFTLSAANNATAAALEHDEIVFGGDSAAAELKASVAGLKNGVPADAPFGPVTFTKPGTYEFNVTENAPEDGAGMTYDRSVQKVRVVVADDNGALTAKVSYTGAATDAAAFTNTYRSSLAYGDAFSLDVTKTLTGRAQKAGEFGFTIVGADKDATDRLAESDKSFTTIAPAAKDVPTKMPGKLAGLRFTQADAGKTFSYTLSEVVPDEKLGGVTYDPTTYRIDIEVVDNADGTMKTITTVSKNGGEPVGTYDSSDGPAVVTLGFKNAYKAAPVEVIPDPDSLGLYKVLKGRDWLDTDTFHFTMKSAVPGQPEPAVAEKDVAAPGAQEGDKVPFSFGSYTFDTPGTYYYAVDETPGNIPGISYDRHPARVVVNVTDNLEGKLVADIKVFEGVFTNTYSWQPVVVDPDAIKGAAVTKVLKGDRATDLADGEFEFRMTTKAIAGSLDTVKDADGKAWPATKTATNKADGSVDFGKMGFSAAGTYEVTIKEVKGDAAHMTYDGHEFTYTIKVAYDPSTGKLSANVEGLDPAKATFTNVYFNAKDAKDVTVNGADKPQASVDGKLVGVGDELVYTIDWVNNAVDKSGTPVAANVTVTDKIPHGTEYVSASEGGKHENGAVTWKLDNQPAGASGTVTLTVRVTDDAVVTGSVENQASIQIGDNKVATNVTKTFVPGKSETTHPDSVKPGETVLSYQIKFHNTDGADATATVVDKLGEGLEYQAGSARVNGEPVEPAVDGSPAAGTTLTWNLSKLDAGQDVVITFNVKVAENGPNTVENQATVNGHETNVETTPFPTKDVKHVYKGDVLVDGKLVGVGETLTFKIDWWHDATLDKDNSTVTVVDKLPDGMKPKSGTISDNGSYDADKGTITWTIENAAGKHGTVAFDAEVTDAVIEAAKRGEVTNIAKVNNHASQSVSVNVPTKTVAKPEGQSGSIKVGDEVVYTINYKNTEDNAATVTITDVLPKGITYKPDSATPAASYDEANRTLTWTLADVASGGSGSVSFTGVVNEDAIKDGINNNAGIQLGENGPVISTNTESTKMGTGDLTISKKVKSAIAGVTAPDAEFTFDVTLTDAAGNQLAGTYSYEGAKQGAIANGNGKITLKHGQSVTIKGLPEGAKYKVVERKLKGFTAIADTVNGAIHKGQAEKVEFINTYTPAAVVIPGGDKGALQVKKVLKGRDWLPNESYSFELQAMTEGAPMPEGAGNIATAIAKKQVVSFGGISFAKPGAYEYRIVETGVSADTNLTFSKAEYKLVVTVKPNGAALTAASVLTQVKDDAGEPANKVLQVPGEVMTFTNTYKKPAQGKDVAAEGKPGTSIDGQLVQVGSRLVYTIDWVNDAVDETGKAVAANVTITDKIPTGTAYDEGSATNGGVYNADTNTLTWSLGKQEANASGTVIFTVEVTEAALNNKVENQANIQIGENKTEMTSKPEVFVPGKKVEDANKGDIQVGDVLTYTVSYANPGKDFATVTITDKLPKGLTYVDGSASGGGSFDKAENKLTWKINDVKAGATGTVTFEARVNESALTNGIANTANVQLGDHAPVVDTNTTPENLPKTSTLKIGKTIKLAENQGTEIDEKKEFSFKITLTDAAGNPLNEDYRYSGEGLDGGVIAAGKDGDMFKLKHGQAITIQGLPVGAKCTITEDDAAGYTPDKKTIEGVVSVDGTSQAAFVNTYSIGDGVTLAAKDGFKASKELVGRDWNGTDKFSAKLMSVNGAPMPDGAKDGVLVKQMTKDSKEVSFGDIKYTAAGEYSYTISEEVGSIGGIKYSDTIYNVKVKVTDKGDGTLAASFDGKYVANGAVEDAKPVDIAKFVNVYSAAVPQGSPVTTANLFSKVLTGRDWKKEDSFSFTITPLNGAPAPECPEATLSGLTTAAGTPVEFDFGAINFTFDHIKDAPVVNGERTKIFVYEVCEIQGDIAGVEYDDNVATLTIRLTDAGDGNLTATYDVTGKSQFTNEYSTEPVNPDGDGATSKAGIQIVKTLTGRPIAASDFKFTMAPADDATKAKFGDAKVIATNAAELGTDKATSNTAIAITPVKTGLEFTLADVGKTYTFDLTETKGGGAGYVNDETKHTLTFTTADNDNGTLSVTATLDRKEAAVWTSGAELTPVSVGFANSYSAGSITVGGQGGVALAGTKQLTGRPMVAGEFHFNVTNAKNDGRVVATGTNAADGTITFTGIKYTTEKLNNDVAAGLATVDRAGKDGDVYTYTYKVSEDAGRKDKGVSIVQGEQTITVKVTDNRAGKLSAKVVYPEGGMVFKNAYGTGEGGSKQIALNGTKVLDVKSGNKVPDIAGKYTFTLAGSEGAPMPAKTTATNDGAGNISFGEITYTMENVFGAPVAKPEQLVIAEDGADTADAKTAGATDAQAAEADAKADDAVAAEAEAKPAEDENAAKAAAADEPMVASAPRSKTFTYKVTENGSVAGVTNDPVATKTIEVKVTDNGDGTLTVDKQAESNKTDFTFTNTYSVKPFDSTLTGKGGFAITKTLDGRDLREGEFEFALVSQGEGEPTVLTAKNDASGKVAFPAISFNAPGEYHYRLAEVDGGLGGVTYDTTVYDATAKVVDNGDGTLGVTWSVSKDGKALEGKEIVFANSYKAVGTSITFNAAKVLTGRELKKGEFTFELRDANGKVLQTVKNGALTEGGYAPVAFDPITYDEPGTYDYRIVEVKGDAEGITYDETVFTYHVVVTDDGNGQLQVEWTVGETGAPVFQNGFVKPENPKPADPAKPADPGNGGSGDKLIQTGDNALVGMFTAAFAGIAAIGAGFTARRKKK